MTTGSGRRWEATTLWNLVWLLNLLYQPLLDPTDPVLQWAVVVAVVATFLPLYLGGYRRAPVLTRSSGSSRPRSTRGRASCSPTPPR